MSKIIKITIIIATLMLLIYFPFTIENIKKTNNLYHSISNSEIIKMEKSPSPKNVMTIHRYYMFTEINLDKAHFWGQMCLFYNNTECVKKSKMYGLKHQDTVSRYDYNNISYEFIENNPHYSVEEKQCYLIYYKTQDDLHNNRDTFLHNYNNCRKYYINSMPILEYYQMQFLQNFKDE